MINEKIYENMKIKNLSEYACKYEDAERFQEESEDLRPSFFRDIDRILYSLSYTRYLDKTQVFTHGANDHLTRRMTHVQYVSKIARTIGRALNLNEDLIEAASLGHDLGHTPFGHVGRIWFLYLRDHRIKIHSQSVEICNILHTYEIL